MVAVVHRLLREEGPRAVTFGRVSREAGVSRTTLYRHWPGPSEMIADAWNGLVSPGPPPASADLRGDLLGMVLRVRNAVESTTIRRSLPTFLEAAIDDPVISDLQAAFIQERRRPMLDRLVLAQEAGELDPALDPDVLVDLLSGPLYYRQLLRRESTSDEQVAHLVDTVLGVARAR